MSKEIDHDYTDEAICPYCGHEESDTWEYLRDRPTDSCVVTCSECKKDFKLTANYDITYCTEPVTPQPQAGDAPREL